MMRGEKQLRHLTFLLNFFDELRRREWRDSLVSNLLELCCSDRECIVGYPSINNAERRAAQNLSRLGVLEIGRMRGIIVVFVHQWSVAHHEHSASSASTQLIHELSALNNQ
jgi:hypothetical protein